MELQSALVEGFLRDGVVTPLHAAICAGDTGAESGDGKGTESRVGESARCTVAGRERAGVQGAGSDDGSTEPGSAKPGSLSQTKPSASQRSQN
ncbi:hypothetical protein EYF80_049653 [Liparis tanakae]|uniref:Uncharacterized protein n=1 Tax=Liparis tanakae TaxID=230148 RepID=A0A4Z2FG48_9TELE|nr:hypothetical protein EYF80_049653 [Liparis tanakae]